MRAITRTFKKVKFKRIETLELKTVFGDIPITWNTEKQRAATKQTTPLPVIVTPDEWSRMRRASIAEDSWLVGEPSSSDYWDWWE